MLPKSLVTLLSDTISPQDKVLDNLTDISSVIRLHLAPIKKVSHQGILISSHDIFNLTQEPFGHMNKTIHSTPQAHKLTIITS